MTIIKLGKDKTKELYYVSANGHTNFGAHGGDILCAAVSVLTQSFVLYAQRMECEQKAEVKDLHVADGTLKIMVEGNVEGGFRMLESGVIALSMQYPNHVGLVYDFGEDKPKDDIL